MVSGLALSGFIDYLGGNLDVIGALGLLVWSVKLRILDCGWHVSVSLCKLVGCGDDGCV